MTDDRDALARFVVESNDLERLEGQLADFNLFEAIGAVRQELRHSDFLSFLLDPNGNHGLGDKFLKRFLERVLFEAPQQPINPVEIDVSDFYDAEIRREWRGIDIFIYSESVGLVCVIENKVDSGESKGQLARYRETALEEFPTARQLLAFLTPDGREPSDPSFIPVSYSDIADIVIAICEMSGSTLGADVVTSLRHYITLLRRHIVVDSEVADLCQKIYRKHKRALDLIFEHRPDKLWDIAEELKRLISESANDGLKPAHSTKAYVRFTHGSWEKQPALMTGRGWSNTECLIAFEARNSENGLSLKLVIAPGPPEIREALYDVAMKNSTVFVGATKPIYPKWTTIFSRKVLQKKDIVSSDQEARFFKIHSAWERFKGKDLPAILEVIDSVDWPEITEAREAP